MTGFDIAVLIIVGLGAIGGFMRGFVHEVLALAAWVVAIAAIYWLHTPLAEFLTLHVGTISAASVLAFAILLLVPYGAIRLFAGWAGPQTRASLLGPVDRLLGLGFGLLKGIVLVVLAFSILVLGYDTAWGVAGRPDWISQARSYPFVNAASDALVQTLSERREALGDETEEP